MFFAMLPNLQMFAAGPPSTCIKTFLGLKTWYAYFPSDWFGGTGYGTCDINNSFQLLGSHSGLLLVGLAIIDDLIRIAALIAVGFVIYGGIQYVTSQGSPDATSKAQQTIVNALIGLAVAVLAAAIVAFVGGKLGNLS